MFFDFSTHPFIKELSEFSPVIRREYDSFICSTLFQNWPEYNLHNGKWNVFGFMLVGRRHELAHHLCPETSKFLSRFPKITTAGFSKLDPGCEIFPHVGEDSSVLRIHLGISIPNGDCRLKVGDTIVSWGNGEIIIFDDTYLHEAWNKTDETRVVLLIDVKKSFFIP